MKLYEISNEIKNIFEFMKRLDELEGDERRQADEFLFRYKDEIKEQLNDKVDCMCRGLKNLASDVDELSDEIDRLQKRKKTLTNQIDKIKNYMCQCLDYSGVTKVDTPLFVVSVVNNPPALSIINEKDIPEEYLIAQPPKVNTTAIKQAIKDGATYDWCELSRTRSVRIK